MYNLISKYINNLNKEDVNNFAIKKKIILNEDELSFLYEFIKKNGISVISNPNIFNIDLYKNKFSAENFNKIKILYTEYYSKYHKYL